MRKAARLSSSSTLTIPWEHSLDLKDLSLTDPRSPLTVWWNDRWWKDRGKRTEEIRFSYHVYLPWQSASDQGGCEDDGKKGFRGGRADEKEKNAHVNLGCFCEDGLRNLKMSLVKGAYATPTQGFEKCIFEFKLDLVKIWVVLVWSLHRWRVLWVVSRTLLCSC